MGTYKYSVSLRIGHPSMDPRTITEALGIAPSRSWQAGELRSTPKGTPLNGINKATYWMARICEGAWPSQPLPNAVADSLDQLADKRAFLHQIRSEEGFVQLFIGWFFDGQSGDLFPYILLARAAEMEIDLAFDIYPDFDEHETTNIPDHPLRDRHLLPSYNQK